jgi:hypothetical protein
LAELVVVHDVRRDHHRARVDAGLRPRRVDKRCQAGIDVGHAAAHQLPQKSIPILTLYPMMSSYRENTNPPSEAKKSSSLIILKDNTYPIFKISPFFQKKKQSFFFKNTKDM